MFEHQKMYLLCVIWVQYTVDLGDLGWDRSENTNTRSSHLYTKYVIAEVKLEAN